MSGLASNHGCPPRRPTITRFSVHDRSKTTAPPPDAAIDFNSAVVFDLTLFRKIRDPFPFADAAIDFSSAALNLLASRTMPPADAAIDFKSATDLVIVPIFTIGYRPFAGRFRAGCFPTVFSVSACHPQSHHAIRALLATNQHDPLAVRPIPLPRLPDRKADQKVAS